MKQILIYSIMVILVSCVRKEVPGNYKETSYVINELVKEINKFNEKCKSTPESLEYLFEYINKGRCPNGELLNSNFEKNQVLDNWLNPIIMKKSKGESYLISCGAEWIEVKVEEDPKGIIESLKKVGEISPFYNIKE